MHNGGLIVKGFKMNSRGKSGCNLLNQGVHFIGDIQSVAVWLTIHVDEHGGFSISGDDGIDRRVRGSDGSNVTEAYRHARGGILDHDLPELFGRAHLSTD